MILKMFQHKFSLEFKDILFLAIAILNFLYFDIIFFFTQRKNLAVQFY